MVVLLSLRVLASHLRRLCLLDRRVLYRPLSWARHPTACALSTSRLLQLFLLGATPSHLCLPGRRLRNVSSQARHSAACASPAGAYCAASFPYSLWGNERTAME